MTNQHPLTDDFCHQIAELWPPEDAAEYDNMRAAADWQLEQVMKWFDENLIDYGDSEISTELLKVCIVEAMRPTTKEKNS